MASLFKECISKLADDVVIFFSKETNNIFDIFVKYFSITDWGRIDWYNVSKRILVLSNKEIVNVLLKQFLEMPVFVLWDEGSLPAVRSTLKAVLNNIDDVTAVSSDTWLFFLNWDM